MSATAVVRPAEQVVRLRTAGFESCVVRPPTWTRGDTLEWSLLHPARASATAFVTTLLASCLVPARRPEEVVALPEVDRARLRRAIVAVCGREHEWRKLHGTHLPADERLMALMLWRWRQHEQLFARLRVRRHELEAAGKVSSGALAAVKVPAGVAGLRVAPSIQKMLKAFEPFPDYARMAKLVNPLADYTELLRPFNSLNVAAGLSEATRVSSTSVALGGVMGVSAFPDPAMTEAARLVRTLYAHPSPLVMARTGGLDGFVWGDSMRMMLGLGEPAWMESVRKISDVFLGTNAMRAALGDLGRGVASPMKFELGLNASAVAGISSEAALLRMPAMPGLVDVGDMLRRYVPGPLWEFPEEWAEADWFMDRWERQALWYLLSEFGLHALLRLAKLGPGEVEEVLLQALEAVVTDGEVVPALRTAVAKAPHLDQFQRIHLDHALERAAEGAYVPASGSLYPGLEGAFTEVGCARALITPERKWRDQPKKSVNFETMVKLLGLEQEFELFIVKTVFGDVGNPYRHGYGDATRGVRRQVLFGIAALAGWLQEFGGVSALDVLSARMAKALPAAIETVTRPALPPGDPDRA